MSTNIKNLLSLNSPDDLCYLDTVALSESIDSIAHFFGFSYLPEEIRIRLFICDQKNFEDVKQKTEFKETRSIIAFTYDVNRIYIMHYQAVKNSITKESYISIILHECTHIFQFYFSKLSQRKYVWLYESIACYLSGQKKQYKKLANYSWDSFVTDFYHMPDCYALAYKFGEALFRVYPSLVLDIIMWPDTYEDRLIELFNIEII